jgi:hypothetical protein
MRITLTEICGPSRIYRDDGLKLREAILRRWSDAEPLEIDFEGASIASISFLDEAIAVLALDHPVDVLKRRLKLVNIIDPDRRLLNAQIVSRARERAEHGGERAAGAAESRRRTASDKASSRSVPKKRTAT